MKKPEKTNAILTAASLLLAQAAAGGSLYWHGDVSYGWQDANNWSTAPVSKTAPAAVPGTTDVVVWRGDAVKTISLNGSRTVQAIVATNAAATISAYQINNSTAGQDLTLSGTAVAGVSNAVVYLGGSANKVMNFGYIGTVMKVFLTGGGDKVFHSDTASGQIQLYSALLETNGTANFVKSGSGRLVISGAYGLTGDLTLSGGKIDMLTSLNLTNSTLNINVTGGSFNMTNTCTYQVAGLTLGGTAIGTGIYTTNSVVSGRAFSDYFSGKGSITVKPRPALRLLVIH